MSQYEQQMLADMIKRLSGETHVFNNGGMKFRNLLSDFLPGQRLERFWICSVFEMASFVAILAQGQLQSPDISRVEFFLHHKLGFTYSRAKWVAETWAIAFGIILPVQPVAFNCPHCSLVGSCDERWRDRLATCPACNALIRFSSSLGMSLEKKGWPKKRAKKRDWILTDPDFTQHESSLRTAISQTIANEELSGSELAKHIGLDLIIGALQTEAVTLLEDSLNRSFAAQEKVVRAILRSSLREEYVCFDLDNQIPSFSSFWREEDFAPGETIVAVIGSVSKTPFHGLAFSDRSLHYAKGDEHWSVSYVELHQLPIKLGDTISQLILGKTRVIDLQGLGVPRRAIQPALSMVGKCIYELSCAAWQ